MTTMKGESHRVYWQQWINGGNNSNLPSDHATDRNRRDLITSSAAIRISEAARARDVTRLLHETIFPSISEGPADSFDLTNQDNGNSSADSLVLVGSLYSLPQHYIQFEHESWNHATNETCNNPGRFSVLHVTKTLSPDDSPLQVWEKMMGHLCRRQESIQKYRMLQLSPSSTSTIAPKLQWFFVPGVLPTLTMEKASTISSFIDLDGYCTAMEDDVDEQDCHRDRQFEDSNDYFNGSGGDDEDLELQTSTTPFPWQYSGVCSFSALNVSSNVTAEDNNPTNEGKATDDTMARKHQGRQQAERLSLQISQYLEQHPHSKAGLLLLQSQQDSHVWRHVYCVLTGESMWFVSRLYYYGDDDDRVVSREGRVVDMSDDSSAKSNGLTWARHGRIPLSRALLLEHPLVSNTDTVTPRIPFGLEIVQANGTSHLFRASNRSVQQGWIHALSRAMSSCHENSLFEHAQVIVEEETRARFQRLGQTSVHPLWEKFSSTPIAPFKESILRTRQPVAIQPDGNVMNVLRLGMQIASFREQCRHARQYQQQFKQMHHDHAPIQLAVVTVNKQASSFSTRATQQSQQTQTQEQPAPSPSEAEAERLVTNNIRATWDAATVLLARATQVAVEFQTTTQAHLPTKPITSESSPSECEPSRSATDSSSGVAPTPKRSMSRSLETLCRHIDYVITGRLRPLSPMGSGDGNNRISFQPKAAAITATANHQQDPAPLDLFDPLLSELQALAVTADLRVLQHRHFVQH